MKKLIVGVIFGIDMIFAMILFVVLSMAYKQHDLSLLFWSVFFGHLPDVSMAVYPFCKKWAINKFGIPSHRPLTHHPILVIPLVIIVCYFLSPAFGYPTSMFIVLAVSNLFVHFVHDSVEPQGMHWLSPFSWGRFTLKNWVPEYVPRDTWYKIHWEKEKKYSASSKDEFAQRVDKVPQLQKIVWGVVFLITIFYCFL